MNNLTKFVGNLHKEISSNQDNTIYSAYSLNVALGMCAYGAKGETKTEIQKALNIDSEEYYNKLIQIASAKDKPYTLTTANAIWINNNILIKENYINGLIANFLATCVSVDFSYKNSVDLINNWASDKTEKKIDKILSHNDVDAETACVLTNAIYFKGNWETQFDKKLTSDREFLHCGKVPTMFNEINVNFYKNEEFSAIELPYEGKELSMVIMLPEAETTEFIDSNFEYCYNKFIEKCYFASEVQLYIPKFKVNSTFDLKKSVQKLGVNQAFSTTADFSDITDIKIKISKIIQKAFIEVDEKGTEAAAVTAVKCCFESIRIPLIFDVNKPFVYAIKHNATNEILFSGHVINPSC